MLRNLFCLASAGALTAGTLHASLTLTPIGTIRAGDAVEIFDESAAEIVSYDRFTKQMYVVNGATDSIDIYSIADPTAPVLVTSVDLSDYGTPNSVDVNPRFFRNEVAVAVDSGDAAVRGTVVFIKRDGTFIDSVEVGFLPDMLTYDRFGFRLVVANEGEPNDMYTIDPEGSVSVIERGFFGYRVFEIGFGGITEADLNGARISGPEGTTIAQDLEPEFITVDPRGRLAYVACQENNAIVVVDIIFKRVVKVFGLGTKNHAELGNAIDASDRDDMIRIANWPVQGLFQPDSIASYRFRGETFIVTANEGDGREFTFDDASGDEVVAFTDESRVEDLELDPSAFPLGDVLKLEENLGRLNVITTQGNIDGDDDFDQLFTFGARSFSIFSTDGELVFDSGDFFETFLALNFPDAFNSDNDENDSFDSRSDAKGPEPEALTLGTLYGKTFAFVGLERFGGIMVFDVTNPYDVEFVTFVNNRDFSIDFDDEVAAEIEQAGDLGPEGIEFVPASASPNGKPLLLVANEVSGTTTVYEIGKN
ncbi:MAG: choice-of-anchor I family protein [Opitutales bacterium]